MLDKDFVEKMKQSLQNMKKEILQNLMSENADFEAIVADMGPKDLADIASGDMDRKTLEAIGSQEINRLKRIDAALARIDNNKYGVCMQCGKKIPKERLEAIPYAMLCIDCKNSDERRNR